MKIQEYNYFFSKKDLKGTVLKLEYENKIYSGKYDHKTRIFEGYHVNEKRAFNWVENSFEK